METIVVLEDNPNNAKQYVKDLEKENNVEKIVILFFYPNSKDALEKLEEVKNFYGGMNVELKRVTIFDYEEILDSYYNTQNSLFLFDLNLVGDGSTTFDNRINVYYAKKKLKESGDNRIWFYTTTKIEQRDILLKNFPDYVLNVEQIGKEGIKLDFKGNAAFSKALGLEG